MSDIYNFNEKRAEHANDAQLWTPLDCINALARDINSGRETASSMVVLYFSTEDCDKALSIVAAGVTMEKAMTMLVLAQHELVRGITKD